MSIYSWVNEEYRKISEAYEDDYDTSHIFAQMTDEEMAIWHLECELDRELRREHGHKPDFYDIVEREIYARGIEPID